MKNLTVRERVVAVLAGLAVVAGLAGWQIWANNTTGGDPDGTCTQAQQWNC